MWFGFRGAVARRRARFACLLLAIFIVIGNMRPAGATGNPDNQLGVYVDWGNPWGREANVEAFETWLGRSDLLALDYMPGGSWNDLVSASQWLPGYWWQGNRNRNLVWSIPLTVSGTSLAQVVDGDADWAFQAIADEIARAQPNAIIRIGWEANGNWFAWSGADGEQADYIAAFQHVVDIFRAASPQFLIDWTVNFGSVNVPATDIYPGDAYVDVIGMDIYDNNPLSLTDPAAAWDNYLNSPFGLRWQNRFAIAHHKPMSYPEWGVGQVGDDEYFVGHMSYWIHNHNVLYSNYWNTNAAYPGMLTDRQYPRSAQKFQQTMKY
jgi:hypothetical protein